MAAGEVKIREFYKREKRMNPIGKQLSNGDILNAAGAGEVVYAESYRYVTDPRTGEMRLAWEEARFALLKFIPEFFFVQDWRGETYHPNSLTAEGFLTNGRRALRVFARNESWVEDVPAEKVEGVLRKLSAKEKEKTLYIIRGVPGSGKSTFVRRAFPETAVVCSMDNYCTVGGHYSFDPALIMSSVQHVADRLEDEMAKGTMKIVVDNTHSRVIEYARWRRMAERHGYSVCVLVIPWKREEAELYASRNLHGHKDIIIRVIDTQMERWESDVHDVCLENVWEILANRRFDGERQSCELGATDERKR